MAVFNVDSMRTSKLIFLNIHREDSTVGNIYIPIHPKISYSMKPQPPPPPYIGCLGLVFLSQVVTDLCFTLSKTLTVLIVKKTPGV